MVWFLSLAQTDMQFSRTELRVREYTYTSIVDWFSTRYKFSWGKNRWLNNLYWNNRMWISTLNHTDNAKCHCKNHNSRRNTKIVCMHVCVRVCVSTNAQHTWRWENHLRCYPPCLRQGFLLFASQPSSFWGFSCLPLWAPHGRHGITTVQHYTHVRVFCG